jgi:hypothetical protein
MKLYLSLILLLPLLGSIIGTLAGAGKSAAPSTDGNGSTTQRRSHGISGIDEKASRANKRSD